MHVTGSLRAKKKAATEAALLDAATHLFVEKGYDNTTIEEIVAEADVSRRTFFRYFGSKEEVIFKGASDDLQTLKRLLRERPPEEASLVMMKNAVINFVRYLEARDAAVLRFVDVVTASPDLTARSAELMGRFTEAVAEELAARSGAAVDVRCRLLAALAIATIAAGVQEWHTESGVKLDEAVAGAFKPAEDGTLFD